MIFTVKVRPQRDNFRTKWVKISPLGPNLHGKNRIWRIISKTVEDRAKNEKTDLNYFQFLYFCVFLNIFPATKLSQWWLFWVQNENGRDRLDFGATTFFFSKIKITFLDIWMILMKLFDISISFRFQNFPKNLSRYGGLYACTYWQQKSIWILIAQPEVVRCVDYSNLHDPYHLEL